MDQVDIDLGDGHTLEWVQWAPDRNLNPQYYGVPDVPRYGASVPHNKPDGSPCGGFVTLDTPEVQAVLQRIAEHMASKGKSYKRPPVWRVEQWEPLTLAPSLLCGACGDHGFIRNGKWVRA